jgi:hypothetical protein
MKEKKKSEKSFQIVDAVLPSADKVTRDDRKRLVRTNAAKYQWSQTKSSQRSSNPHNDSEGFREASSGDVPLLAVDNVSSRRRECLSWFCAAGHGI